jgi:hypothetical protein
MMHIITVYRILPSKEELQLSSLKSHSNWMREKESRREREKGKKLTFRFMMDL